MEYLAAWMFLALTILLMAGFPVAFTLLGTSLMFGLIGFGWSFFDLLPLRIWLRLNDPALQKSCLKQWEFCSGGFAGDWQFLLLLWAPFLEHPQGS